MATDALAAGFFLRYGLATALTRDDIVVTMYVICLWC